MEATRKTGLNMLAVVCREDKNRQKFEQYIYGQAEKLPESGRRDAYLWYIYQICGAILARPGELKAISTEIKSGQIGWKAPLYHAVASRIDEHDEYLVKPFEVVDGVTECGKCGSKKTWSVQKQTRGSDEPMTTFSRCVTCGHQWTYAG